MSNTGGKELSIPVYVSLELELEGLKDVTSPGAKNVGKETGEDL